ncbi:hypothetical protein [Bacillus cereus]|uniref:Conjugal transfer protein n=1 Tax=Bacillus cereus TaxID=1396 RepID=A0A164QC46_BACCE|nr:hypothetical protein [Bacillus cereus]KZD70943.1 hypothetical protein B4088_0999 [Bacillus cereus]BCC56628.1 hypothetical protein BCJMU07_p327 [Bacillus cereus]BCD32891.1 hypothetical protein BC30102_p320 [Bacillus cereus]
MKEKKEFLIPQNVSPQFEVFQNVTIKDLLIFVPSVVIDVPLIFLDISIYVKAPIISITAIVPMLLVYFRPVRQNIPFWQHGKELLRFAFRQRVYEYQKEVESYEYTPKFESSEKIDAGETKNEKTIERRTPEPKIGAGSYSN